MRWAMLLVAAVTVAVWSAGIGGPYQFDDTLTPQADPASASLQAWAEELPRTLRPLTKLTYAVEASLGLADTPPARRVVGIFGLAASAALLLALLRRFAPELPLAGATLLALLYAVHPIHAESTLAVAGRSAALAAPLLLGALLAHARGRPVAAAVLLCAAALARETALAGLLPLLVIDRRRIAPALAAVTVAVAWIALTPRVQALAAFSFDRPIGASIVAQVAAVPVGLSLYLRPGALSIDHGVPLTVPLFTVGVAIYLAAAIALRRAPAAAAAGLALWLAALLPTQSLIPKLDALTERPLGLALAGLLLAAAPLCARLPARRLAAVAGVAVAALLVVATVARGRLYGSPLQLWADAAQKSSANARPHFNHALLLAGAGRRDEALAAIAAARRIDPFDPALDGAERRIRESGGPR